MGYRLNTEALRVVQRNERGVVTYRKRYRKGQVVDTSKMEDYRVEALVAAGALVEGDEVESTDDTDEPTEDPAAAGAGPVPTATAGASEPQYEDDLDETSYSDLQRIAKEETGDGSGNTEALITRIRAHRAAE